MITVADDRGFNDAADFGARHASMDTPAINMPNLSGMLAGFDYQPPAIEPGTFMRNIEASAKTWGDDFGTRVADTQAIAKNYWGTPTTPVAAAPTAAKPSLFDSIGNLADGLANNLTGTQPMVETGHLNNNSGSSLTGGFGQLAQNEGSAFERRYQAQTPRKPGGSDYV